MPSQARASRSGPPPSDQHPAMVRVPAAALVPTMVVCAAFHLGLHAHPLATPRPLEPTSGI